MISPDCSEERGKDVPVTEFVEERVSNAGGLEEEEPLDFEVAVGSSDMADKLVHQEGVGGEVEPFLELARPGESSSGLLGLMRLETLYRARWMLKSL